MQDPSNSLMRRLFGEDTNEQLPERGRMGIQPVRDARRPLTIEERAQLRHERKEGRRRWTLSRQAEIQYRRQLRRTAKIIGDYIHNRLVDVEPNDPEFQAALADIESMLWSYAISASLRDWAEAATRRLLEHIDRRDKNA
jgi:hypothetical protein